MANPVLVARAPMRISFSGGGTDLPSYYEQHTGMVLSMAINKYIYVIVQPASQPSTQIVSAGYGSFQQWEDDKMFWGRDLALPQAVLEYVQAPHNLDILIASGVPPGTGLGSSSAVAVAMLTALYGWEGQHPSAAELAEAACDVELNKMGMPIGKQDQYAAALGGFNQITFHPERVEVQPLALEPDIQATLERRLMLFYTGHTRDASAILAEQNHATSQGKEQIVRALDELKIKVTQMVEVLQKGELDVFGGLLHAAWKHKKQLHPRISNKAINKAYQTARAAGAVGGKISGAGGGGYLLLYAGEQHQSKITSSLAALRLSRLEFAPDWGGASMVSQYGVGPGGTYAPSAINTIGALPYAKIAELARLSIQARRIFIMGNGGSASTASHMAGDLAKGTGLRNVLSLVDHVPSLTAWANDQGYEDVFAEQLRAHEVREGDLVIVISGSGKSPNVLRAVQTANEAGATTVGLVGFDGGKLRRMVNHLIHVKNDCMEQVEDMHLMIAHMVARWARRLRDESTSSDS